MIEPNFPDELKRFVIAHIDTVEQLDVLLLVCGRPTDVWTPQRVNAELRSSLWSATVRLERLCATGLAERVKEGVRARPVGAELEHLLRQVAVAYRERRVSLVSLIYSRLPEGVRVFVDGPRPSGGE